MDMALLCQLVSLTDGSLPLRAEQIRAEDRYPLWTGKVPTNVRFQVERTYRSAGDSSALKKGCADAWSLEGTSPGAGAAGGTQVKVRVLAILPV